MLLPFHPDVHDKLVRQELYAEHLPLCRPYIVEPVAGILILRYFWGSG